MKAKIVNGEIVIHLQSIIESLSKEDYKTFARSMVADADLFSAILECVSSEGTLGRYYSDDKDGAWWFDSQRVLELREKLIPLMPEIAKQAVRGALQHRNDAQTKSQGYERWAWEMYHAWNRSGNNNKCPEGPPKWMPSPVPDEAEVDGLFKGSEDGRLEHES